MGAALAEAALARGARVTLLAAAVEVPLPEGADIVRVETAADLGAALRAAMADEPRADALVMAAAVADFTPAAPMDRKIARAAGLTLELSPTPDLLAEVAAAGSGAYLVGFAAETGGLDRVPGKLAAKGIDLLVANDVSEPGSGFGTDTNRVTLFEPSGAKDELPMLPKREVADRILDRVAAALDDREAGAQTASMHEPVRTKGAR
jgi:phosphopantothenoylcysteine decarboxylase/phosphopantothenate--cysteine ligase